ncbi:MAG: DUF1631 domain-containing protein [Pseudomonadales bacterium]|nr:DUF1631 domain-containing protein [Pseudomonadales bacterium]
MNQNADSTTLAGNMDPDVLDGSIRLPNPLLKIRDITCTSLAKHLGKMFDEIDDSFFEQADSAGNNSEQTMYFDSMREVRIKRRSVEKAFKHEVHKKFRDLLVPETEEVQSDLDVTSDEMSILQDDIMEVSVAITSMVMKARNSLITELYNAHKRVNSLFHYEVVEKRLPFDPQQLCDIFATASELFDLDIRARISVYKQFDRFVMSQLPLIIKTANSLLVEAGVLPKLKIKANRSRSLPPRRRVKSSPVSRENNESTPSLEGDPESVEEYDSNLGFSPGAVSQRYESKLGTGPFEHSQDNGPDSRISSGVPRPQQSEGHSVWNGPQYINTPMQVAATSEGGGAPSPENYTSGHLASGPSENQAGKYYVSPHSGASGGVFHLLQDMMSDSPQYGNTPITSSDASSSIRQANVVRQPALLGMLSQMQADQSATYSGEASPNTAFNIRDTLQNILVSETAEGERSVISRIDEDTINLVSMFFDFILDDHNLPVSIQALISRLQIPVLKLAIKDKAFFNKGVHPARKLLNELARAGLGLDETSKDNHDVVFKKISNVVHRILEEYDGEVALFDELYIEFSEFFRSERKRSAVVEQRTREVALGRAKTDGARRLVDKIIQDRIEGQNLPHFIVIMLRDTWSKLLFRIGVKEGPESEEWYRAIDAVDQLIWSVVTRRSKNERQRWARILPVCLKSLRHGFKEIAYAELEAQAFFEDLQKTHATMLTLSLTVEVDDIQELPNISIDSGDQVPIGELREESVARNPDPSIVAPSRIMPEEDAVEDISELILKETAHVRATAHEPQNTGQHKLTAVEQQQEKELAASYIYLKKIDAIEVGSWLEFSPLNEPQKRCRLAVKLPENDHLVFVNRRGLKVIDRSRSQLASEMRKGRLSVIDSRPVFDRALDAIVGALSTKKNKLNENQVAAQTD